MLLKEVTLWLFYCRYRRQLERVIAAQNSIICSLNISMELLRLKKRDSIKKWYCSYFSSAPSTKSVAFAANSAQAILCLLYRFHMKQMVNL